jgi:hypothetical protein
MLERLTRADGVTLRHKGHEEHKAHEHNLGLPNSFVAFVFFVIFVPERKPSGLLGPFTLTPVTVR